LDRLDYLIVSGDFAERTGIPALVYTSMNGANQPIVESSDEALEFFFRSQDINCLILENFLVYRRDVSDIVSDDHSRAQLAAAVIISLVPLAGEERLVVTSPQKALNLDSKMLSLLQWLRQWQTMPDIRCRLHVLGVDDESFWPVVLAGFLAFEQSHEDEHLCRL
jgi:hypothetical protein